MKKKLNKYLLSIYISAVLITAIGSLWIGYQIFQKNMIISTGILCLFWLLGSVGIFCMVLIYFMTKHIVRPILEMSDNIEQLNEQDVYEEMRPFVAKMKEQHLSILQNAQMRQEFTANVSHELKTPLTSISGYAELIGSGMANESDTIHFANEINHNANRLLTLINDILKLSELDETDMEIKFEPVDLLEIAKDCINMLKMKAEKHSVALLLQGESAIVDGNKQMLEELVYNLCDNGIRYNNPDGRVLVQVEKGDYIQSISVKDTGIGISPEHQERIFERFYRVDKSRSKSTGGTGLGLAIVKHIAAQHKAEIEVQSKKGIGTEISVYFNRC